jgi:hypothetical protein
MHARFETLASRLLDQSIELALGPPVALNFEVLRLLGKVPFEYPYQVAFAPRFNHSRRVGLRKGDQYSAAMEALKTFASAAENHGGE